MKVFWNKILTALICFIKFLFQKKDGWKKLIVIDPADNQDTLGRVDAKMHCTLKS